MLALLAIDPVVALHRPCFGASYAVITWRSGSRLHNNSLLIAREQTELVKALQEGLGGIRDVLLDGTQPVYCEAYGARRPAAAPRPGRQRLSIAQSPRYVIEALGMILIAILAYGLSRQPGGIATALPSSAHSHSARSACCRRCNRALPPGRASQETRGPSATRSNSSTSRSRIARALRRNRWPSGTRSASASASAMPPMAPGSSTASISQSGGARVGFVGSTGSGKSTTLDLSWAC